ncbi:hypothetical protein [Bathymodiolus septemdierum thioautotrophic gill symbiont]|uniref:Uncharacterized protein n=1 Tax=endosymbiont of Bathymodiolus septemdierum str. Myojin knoll TaxID=1303921 RepID=A0A0N7KBL6_9GAMM|nr:hypothetical protein [Bathymodiolus septemdierum thioautotrophic gill symbiont]BAS68359.1 hypothetical protein BSEPE_1378 [endosymbiont of Bathymodiolus septemdierum str. Myojin knoll]
MKKYLLGSILITLSISSIASDFACKVPVQSFGNIKKMTAGDFSPNVLFKDVKLSNTSVGYGPGADHQYELTIVNGVVYMARPGKDDEVMMRTILKEADGAAMLQIATPKAWKLYGEMDDIDSFNGLAFEMDDVVEEIECGENVLMPFKIIGYANSLTWSMDTENPRVVNSKNQSVEVVGLYNVNNKQKYFMVKGYNIHPHVLLTNLGEAGHLRNISLQAGAKLYLPQK